MAQSPSTPVGESHCKIGAAANRSNHVLSPLRLEDLISSFFDSNTLLQENSPPSLMRSQLQPAPKVYRNAREQDFSSLYELGKTLGSGGYAQVRLATCYNTGEKFAVKVIDMLQYKPEDLRRVYREIDILKKVRHPSCISMKECFITLKHTYIIMELASGGDLLDKLLQKKRFSEREAATYTRQILEGVAYLHSRGIVHRDMKLENLLLKPSDPVSQVKIGDFGLSKCFRSSCVLTTICGSPGYVAPEVLNVEDNEKNTYTEKVDEWGVGVILYTLLSGFAPFDRENEYEKIKMGHYSMEGGIWDTISAEGKEMVESLMCVDPETRLTAQQALEHPWIKALAGESKVATPPRNFSPRSSPLGKSPMARNPLSPTTQSTNISPTPKSPTEMKVSPRFKKKENIFQPTARTSPRAKKRLPLLSQMKLE